ncbi:DASH family cryptochrome [Flavobacterium terrae]|uniref:Cryptochrome DASH n=1 Tax=Flavobacterium terrae TaxID=415425 RepID=A0A1M6EVG5_9FLAO|nr:DASH family cryptochrome [Flavobacterium terrae]SHI89451.1 deoxyribodipyrimidine photo-lyase (single-stranded DNA-specific) [Flavobacterium terrae]
MQRVIVWFKTDLRLNDNEVLFKAIQNNKEIIPVYCLDVNDFDQGPFGFKRTGKFRTKFLLESLQDLNNELKKRGSGLIILKGKPEIEIPKIVLKYGATKIYTKKEVAYIEKNTLEKVQKEVSKINCDVSIFSTSTLYHPEDLPFSIKDIPDVFTDFRKKVEKESTVRPIYNVPNEIKSPFLPEFNLPLLSHLIDVNTLEFDDRSVLNFEGGEANAIKRLNYYLFDKKLILNYKQTRNGLLGSDYSTKLSPWLAMGSISPRYIYAKIKDFEAEFGENESTYWLIFELLWRDFFRFMFKKHNDKLFLLNGLSKTVKHQKNTNLDKLDSWIKGETGNDFVDANMQELKATGFMSNRGRQVVASYLINDLKVDWRYGASYFEQELIDYDVSNNWGNWAYLAGVGNDPRSSRYFDTEKQASEYDKNGEYRKKWITTNNVR